MRNTYWELRDETGLVLSGYEGAETSDVTIQRCAGSNVLDSLAAGLLTFHRVYVGDVGDVGEE